MSSCSCCLVENGHNIILELVTISIASFLMIVEICATCNVFLLLCEVSPIVASAFGIAALKRQHDIRLGDATVGAAIVTGILYCVAAVLMLIGFSVIATSRGLAPYENTALNITRDTSGMILCGLFALSYIMFGLGTSLSLAVKHWRISRTSRRNAERMEQGTMTVHYYPPMESHFASPALPSHQQQMGNIYYNPQGQPELFNPKYPPPGQPAMWNPYAGAPNMYQAPIPDPAFYSQQLQGQHPTMNPYIDPMAPQQKEQPPPYDN